MHRNTLSVSFLPALLFGALQLFLEPAAGAAEQIRAAMSAPQPEAWWMERHERTVARIRQGHVDLLFIGDSITQGWEEDGRPVWNAFYQHRHAANLGYNGDQTDNVLWRLQNGELDGITPKLAVVMIGTNNATRREDPPEETAAGIQAILTTLRTRLPDTKILLLAVFPRGFSADDRLRRVNQAGTAQISTATDEYTDTDPSALTAMPASSGVATMKPFCAGARPRSAEIWMPSGPSSTQTMKARSK